MVFDIDFGTKRGCTMFDIEVYQRESEHERTKGLWSSEIHVLPCVEGITRFLESKRNDNTFDYDEFIEHAKVIQELRGWLYEVEGNKPLPSVESSKIHYDIRVKYVKSVIYAFAEKYNLYVNVD